MELAFGGADGRTAFQEEPSECFEVDATGAERTARRELAPFDPLASRLRAGGGGEGTEAVEPVAGAGNDFGTLFAPS